MLSIYDTVFARVKPHEWPFDYDSLFTNFHILLKYENGPTGPLADQSGPMFTTTIKFYFYNIK